MCFIGRMITNYELFEDYSETAINICMSSAAWLLLGK